MNINIIKEIEELYEKGNYEEARKKFVNFHNDNTYNLDKEQLNQLLTKVSSWVKEKEISELFSLRGMIYLVLNNIEKSLYDLNKAIHLNPLDYHSYIRKGWILSDVYHDHKGAIELYNKAIGIDDSSAIVFINRGNAYLGLNNFKEAESDFEKAIKKDKNNAASYIGLGNLNHFLENHKLAIDNYNKAQDLDPTREHIYFNRALAYKEDKMYNEALIDYQKFIEISKNEYWIERAKEIFKEIEEELDDSNIDFLQTEINKIKTLLEFKKDNIAHFTNLIAIKALLIGGQNDKGESIPSSFRVSEANYMNDTSEGQKLKKYINIEETIDSKDYSSYVEKPFLVSFVEETNRNALTLWRMYAKTNNIDGNGCAIVLSKEKLLKIINETILPENEARKELKEDEFNFYKVAYLDSNGICIGDDSEEINQSLNKIKKLIEDIKEKKDKSKIKIALERLIDIEYLFKGIEYQHECEVRLIISKTGKEEHITINTMEGEIPKVYLEIGSILSAVKTIVIGPKVERSEEWASAFNYTFLKNDIKDVKIEISKLPYK